MPLQPETLELTESQTLLQPAQFDVVFVGVSQPLVSGAVELQLAWPALQLV